MGVTHNTVRWSCWWSAARSACWWSRCILGISPLGILFSSCCRQPYVNSLDKAAQCSTPAILKLLQARFPTELLDNVKHFRMRSEDIVCSEGFSCFYNLLFWLSSVRNVILACFPYQQEGRTALLVQAAKGDLSAVQKLLEKRANVDAKDRVRSSSPFLFCVSSMR